MKITKNKKLAAIGQKIAKTKRTISIRIKSLLKRIYLSRLFNFIRPVTERLRKIFRPLYQYLKSKYKKYKIQISYFFLIFIGIIVALGIFKLDLDKQYGYDPVEPINFENIDWKEKVDNEGYNYSARNKYKWKVVITPPNKSFLFKPSSDIAEVKMYIKDLKGSIQVPAGTTIIDQEGKSKTTKGVQRISNQKEVVLVGKCHFTSLLGLSFISPNQGVTIRVDGYPHSIATVQLPKKSKVIKFGDQYLANSYKIDKRNYFFHAFSNPAIVYYQYNYHLFIQALIAIALIIFILIIIYFKKFRIKRIRFRNRHFIISALAIFLLMIMLSLAIPNPKTLVISLDQRSVNYPQEENMKIIPSNWIPRYLRWALFINQSVDGVIIGNVKKCSGSEYSLGRLGIQKFIVIEDYRNSQCTQQIMKKHSDKTVFISQSAISEELSKIKGRDYRYNNKLFRYNAKIVFLLSNILLALACAFLIWKAVNIKKLRDFLFFIVYGFSSYFLLIFVYIIVGFAAHMPIGYHGTHNIGLIMSNYFLPGTISGGNNLRTFFALLGCLFIIITSTKVFKKLNLQIYFIIISLFCILMLIPKVEYHSKRFVLSALSAEAYIWDYKMDVFNSLDLYKSIREAKTIEYYQKVTDPKTYGDKDIDYAVSLKNENRMSEAQEKLNDILHEYRETDDVVARAKFELADLYLRQAKSKEDYGLRQTFVEKNSYYKLALEEYLNFISKFPEDDHTPKAIQTVGKIYLHLQDYSKAIKTYESILRLYLDKPFIPQIKLELAAIYLDNRNYGQAINLYKNILDNSLISNTSRVQLLLADSYIKNNETDRALKIYQEMIEKNISDINTEFNIYRNISNVEKFEPTRQTNLLLKALEMERAGKKKEAIRQYLNVENIFSNKTNTQFAKYRLSQLMRNAGLEVSSTENGEYLTNSSNDKLNETIKIDANSNISQIIKSELGILKEEIKADESIEVYVNNEFKITEASESNNVVTINSIDIKIKDLQKNCGNKICDIGENSFSCNKDCSASSNIISIKGYAENVSKSNWPYLQLKIDGDIVKEWRVETEILSDFSIPLEFLKTGQPHTIELINAGNENNIFIEEVSINQIQFDINRLLSPVSGSISKPVSTETESAEELTGYKLQIEKIKEKLDVILQRIIPFDYKSFLESRYPSRGMTLYFTSIICFLFLAFLSKSVRTLVISFTIFFMSRGILRVAEQDPLRAWVSIAPGVTIGFKFVVIFIIINSFLLLLLLLLRIILGKYKIKLIKK